MVARVAADRALIDTGSGADMWLPHVPLIMAHPALAAVRSVCHDR
jgi:hypothetical protein